MTHDPTDDVLKDLEAALTVKPSPAFAEGVRARIRETSVRRRMWPAWATAGLAAAAAVVLAVLAWPRQELPPAAVRITAPPPAESAAPARTITAPSAGTIAGVGADGKIAKPHGPRPESRRAAAREVREKPEVLVPGDQALALQTLVSGLTDGTIDAASLATAPPDASMPLAPVVQIEIVPIVIPPIDVRAPGTSGGGLARGRR